MEKIDLRGKEVGADKLLALVANKLNGVVDWINEHEKWLRNCFYEQYNARGEPDPK